ncbi:hypothetical protein KKI24_24445 [bacterium]|nr:hypothetical protein [bacterium]
MCDKCDGKLLLLIGEIKGTVEQIKAEQGNMRTDICELRKEITGVKIKAVSIGSILGGVAGFLTKYIS